MSRDITNEEIFYIGGKTDGGNISVLIYIQNLNSGETTSALATSDKRGDWFYRHSGFLSPGEYLLWTQARLGDEFSPPSPQIQMSVEQKALQFGASRISYELFYLLTAIVFFIILCGMTGFIIFHVYHGRRHYKMFLKEMREAEEAVHKGFAILRRDIQAELNVIHKVKSSKEFSEEEQQKEKKLLKDLEWVERYIEKEILDMKYLAQ